MMINNNFELNNQIIILIHNNGDYLFKNKNVQSLIILDIYLLILFLFELNLSELMIFYP